MSPAERSQTVGALISTGVYALVAWGYSEVIDPGTSVWKVFAVLCLLRAFFAAIEGLGGILTWRLYGRRRATAHYLAYLQSNEFPMRKFMQDDLLTYLSRIEGGIGNSQNLKLKAKELENALAFYEGMGILLGARSHSAAAAALEIYSPKANAPPFATE